MKGTRKQAIITEAIEWFKAKMRVECSGGEGAYFAFAVSEKGESGLTFGGRIDLSGVMFSQTLAQLVYQTPGLDEEYIDVTLAMAKKMYREIQEGFHGGNVQ